MPTDRSSYAVHLDADPGRASSAQPEAASREDRVFRLAICADVNGRGTSSPPFVGAMRAWRVDRDDFEAVLSAISPQLQLALGDGIVVDVRIRELDDFHPDQLFERVPQFARLRELRAELASPSTFSRAAAKLSAATPPARPALPTQAGLLDAIVGADPSPPHDTGAQTGDRGGGSDDLYAFIQRVMAPHLVARTDPRQAELLAQVDAAIGAIMRAVLHHPTFQSLEALWRGVFRLVREVETSERMQIHLVDMPRESMVTDLASTQDARATQLYQALQAVAPLEHGGWGLLVAHHAFGGDSADIETLAHLAAVGAALNAPWIAEALPHLALGGLSEAATADWERLRHRNDAHHLGLAMPRVLLRLPYGKTGDETERFSFEELSTADEHSSYLWGNPALFCAAPFANGATEGGDGHTSGAGVLVKNLPLHIYRRDGQAVAKPCAEVIMGEDDANALLEAGFIPMCALRDQDVMRIPRLQSVAEPLRRLAGQFAR